MRGVVSCGGGDPESGERLRGQEMVIPWSVRWVRDDALVAMRLRVLLPSLDGLKRSFSVELAAMPSILTHEYHLHLFLSLQEHLVASQPSGLAEDGTRAPCLFCASPSRSARRPRHNDTVRRLGNGRLTFRLGISLGRGGIYRIGI